MFDPGYTEEKKIQFEKDKAAYETLTDGQKKAAENIAKYTFGARKGLVIAGRTIVGVLETFFNLFIRLPYALALGAVKLGVKGLFGAAKMGVSGIVASGKACLAVGRAALNAGEKCLDYFRKKGWISEEKKTKGDEKIEGWKQNLLDMRDRVVQWGQDVRDSVDRNWEKTKQAATAFKHRAGYVMEYYGALALYRGAKWVLNPRTPSGKPLLRWEPLNKAVGLGMAAAGFAALAWQLSLLTVLSKIWHMKLAASFVTDPASLAVRIFKQVTLQPAITLGVTAAKFVSLPLIAASRAALKSSPFMQGTAYQYNLRINEKTGQKLQKKFDRAARDADILRSSRRSLEKYTRLVSMYLHKKSFSFVGSFIAHIAEKASPEFYEARIKHYQTTTEKKNFAAAAVTSAPVQLPANGNLAKDFNKTEAAAVPPAADSPAAAPASAAKRHSP